MLQAKGLNLSMVTILYFGERVIKLKPVTTMRTLITLRSSCMVHARRVVNQFSANVRQTHDEL